MSYRGFVRDYRDYLKKKRSSSSFCKNTVQTFCSKINTQGQYLLYKTYQIPCYNAYTIAYAKPPPQCASCQALNTLYDGVPINPMVSEFI
jgi:hypothetical protein